MKLTLPKTMTAVGCHIYAGGFTLGVRKHFRVLAHMEEWLFGTATVQKNMPEIRIIVGKPFWNAAQFRGIDFLYGNPPCAAWSNAGARLKRMEMVHQDRWRTDERVGCTRALFSAFEKIEPRAFVWESVTQAFTYGRELVDEKAKEAISRGYEVRVVLVNGLDCGVPQARKRMFFVAARCQLDFERPSHRWVTIGECLKGVPKSWGAEVRNAPRQALLDRKELWGTRPGKTDYFRKVWEEQMGDVKENRPAFLDHRPTLTSYGNTLTGGPKCYHPTEPRLMNVAEYKRMCTYPDDYEFVCPNGMQYAEMCKAVMPKTAEWLAGEIARSLRANKPSRRDFAVVDFLKPKGTS
jgi:DNA (cytosine-5)-methyltransferase 1